MGVFFDLCVCILHLTNSKYICREPLASVRTCARGRGDNLFCKVLDNQSKAKSLVNLIN